MASALATAVLVLSMAGLAAAAGTTAGTVVTNTATVDFTINGQVQPTLSSAVVDFTVDRRIDLTVTTLELAHVTVNPATTNNGLRFTLLNSSNATLDFALTVANNPTDPYTANPDDFDPTAFTAVVDNGDNLCNAADAGQPTTVPSLGEDLSVTVCILSTIPGAQGDGTVSAVTLTATAHEAGGGAAVTEDAGADVEDTMQTVFGDGAGDTDGSRDAAYSDTSAYMVASADITITKTQTLISDPINGNGADRKYIPGAIVEYVVTVTNDAGSSLSATALTISDVLQADLVFEADTYAVGQGIDLDGTPLTNAADADPGSFAAGTVTVTLPSLAPGASAVITFRAAVF